ncbi:MAG: molybdenum cofactor biosynthesis protein MoaE [Anaerolineae bacterium]
MGGAGKKRFEVVMTPIDVNDVVGRVMAPAYGAVTTFIGVVRNHSRGRQIRYLEYEAYPEMAEEMLAQIGREIQERWPAIEDVSIVHRIGRQEPGEISVVIAVTAAHRAETFDAARYAIERIKEIVPIWKREVAVDGEWWVEGPADNPAGTAH